MRICSDNFVEGWPCQTTAALSFEPKRPWAEEACRGGGRAPRGNLQRLRHVYAPQANPVWNFIPFQDPVDVK